MESSINERLKQSVEYKKINPPDIYNKIGVRRQIWGGWLNQNQAIPLDKLVKIVKLMSDIDARWLLTGEGEMINQAGAIPELVEEPKATYKNSHCCSRCKDLENQIELYKKVLSLYENPPKKETTNEDSTQVGEDAKQNKAG
jgi:predicted methyltransferase